MTNTYRPDRRAGFEDRNGNTVRVGDAAIYFNGDPCVVKDVTQDGDATVCWAAGAKTGVPGTRDTVKWNNLARFVRATDPRTTGQADPLPDADAAQHAYWTEADWNDRIVRPAPSGPVVEETVKRIVPGVYGIVEVALVAEARVGSQTLTRVSIVADTYSSTDILAAAEILRQIGEAMEGK